jgi:hypothetical protein
MKVSSSRENPKERRSSGPGPTTPSAKIMPSGEEAADPLSHEAALSSAAGSTATSQPQVPERRSPPIDPARAAMLRKAQWRRGFDPHDARRHSAPTVRLHEHQVHGRGS